MFHHFVIRIVCRYQRGIRIRILKKNRQYNDKKKEKQRFTKHTHKTKDRVTRTPLYIIICVYLYN